MKEKVGTRSSSHRVGCAFFSGEFQREAMPVDVRCLLCYNTRCALTSFFLLFKDSFQLGLRKNKQFLCFSQDLVLAVLAGDIGNTF